MMEEEYGVKDFVKSDSLIERQSRRTGNTTRMIDSVIQELFSGRTVLIVYEDGSTQTERCRYVLDVLLKRMKLEHPGVNVNIKSIKGKYFVSIDN